MDSIKFVDGQVKVVFEVGDKSFFINSEEGLKNLEKLKHDLGVDNLGYLKQIHSNRVIDYKFENLVEADGLVFSGENTCIGVFTADCVPIILYDKINNTISAVHSGWRGTYKNIVSNAVNMMLEKNCEKDNIKVIIGPHIRECCYEVGDEVINSFKEEFPHLSTKKISMEKIITEQLYKIGIKKENITLIGECTYCLDNKYYSYRRDNGNCGRMFSYVYIN